MDAEFLELLKRHLRFVGDRDVDADSRLRDLGLDSMHAIELLFVLEDTYEVVFPDDTLIDATFETAGSLWAVLQDVRRSSLQSP